MSAAAQGSYQPKFYPEGVGFPPYSPAPSSGSDDSKEPEPMKRTAFRIPKIPAVTKLMLGSGALIAAGTITLALSNVITLIPVLGPAFAAALAIGGFAVAVIGIIGFALGFIGTSLELTAFMFNQI